MTQIMDKLRTNKLFKLLGNPGKQDNVNTGIHSPSACCIPVQWNLDLRKPDLRKNLDLRKIVGTTDFLVHKLFDLRKIF